MINLRYKRSYLLFSISLLLFVSCVTQKRRDDLSGMAKLYHNTTAKYNGYYNAEEIVYLSTLQLNEQFQDNYTKLLPIYPYSESDQASTSAGELDKAIEKLGIVINLHRVSKWTDDSYLLMGQAQYIKGDFESARETFEYLVDEFNPKNLNSNNRKINASDQRKSSSSKRPSAREKKQREKTKKQAQKERAKLIKNRKKQAKKNRSKSDKSKRRPTSTVAKTPTNSAPAKSPVKPPSNTNKNPSKEKPEETFDNDNLFDHQPAYFEGVVWLARTYMKQGNYYGAQELITNLLKQNGIPDEVSKQANLAIAESKIKQNLYPEAIAALQKAFDQSEDKSERARIAYIKGQLQEMEQLFPAANLSYDEVLASRGNFEMDFNANLRKIIIDHKHGSLDETRTKKELESLIKEAKNSEFRDQLYYALAQMALESNNRSEAKSYLHKAVVQPSNVVVRKAESLYLLASLYFEDENFIQAHHYFDSTFQVMAKNDERYPEVEKYRNALGAIAQQLEIIQLTDSLIRISYLSDSEKKKLAAAIIKKREAEEAAKEAERENKALALNRNASAAIARVRTTNIANSSFFAYDEKVLKKGLRDFISKWGNRSLEEDWRRSNRANATLNSDPDLAVNTEENQVVDDSDLEEIFKNVPRNAQEVARSKESILEAKFRLGVLFRDNLEDYKRSNDYLEEVLKENPDHPKKLDAYFYLYLNYQDLNDAVNAKIYYDKILKEGPDSKYSIALSNPNYWKDAEAEKLKAQKYYEETYQLYISGDYQTTQQRINRANEMFGKNNPLKAKFALLNVFCIGNLEGKEKYVNTLKDFIAQFPKTEEQVHARELLRILYGGDKTAFKGSNAQIVAYQDRENASHYLLVVLYNSKDFPISKAKTSIFEFSKKFYKQKTLRLSTSSLDGKGEIPFIIIRDFKTKKSAMDYFQVIQKNKIDFLPEDYRYDVFPISLNNWRTMMKSKDVEGYKDFFEKEYLD